jgi:hypothetical protein
MRHGAEADASRRTSRQGKHMQAAAAEAAPATALEREASQRSLGTNGSGRSAPKLVSPRAGAADRRSKPAPKRSNLRVETAGADSDGESGEWRVVSLPTSSGSEHTRPLTTTAASRAKTFWRELDTHQEEGASGDDHARGGGGGGGGGTSQRPGKAAAGGGSAGVGPQRTSSLRSMGGAGQGTAASMAAAEAAAAAGAAAAEVQAKAERRRRLKQMMSTADMSAVSIADVERVPSSMGFNPSAAVASHNVANVATAAGGGALGGGGARMGWAAAVNAALTMQRQQQQQQQLMQQQQMLAAMGAMGAMGGAGAAPPAGGMMGMMHTGSMPAMAWPGAAAAAHPPAGAAARSTSTFNTLSRIARNDNDIRLDSSGRGHVATGVASKAAGLSAAMGIRGAGTSAGLSRGASMMFGAAPSGMAFLRSMAMDNP